MTLRFGVAGTGYWAETVHLAGLASRPDIELVGLWGRTHDKTAALAKARGIAAFRSFEEMLAEIDVVSIAVSPQSQADLALAAAKAGKHLLLEKPLATSPDAARAIATAARGQAALVFFMRRFIPEIEAAIQAAQKERWLDATVRIHSAALLGNGPYAQSIWRQAYAGALWDVGPHVVSVLTPLLGAIEAVEAACSDERIVTLATQHRGGASANISLSLHADPATVGSAYTFRNRRRAIMLQEPTLDRPALLARAAGDLIDMIATGNFAHRCDLRLGVEAVEVLAAAARSIESGQCVEISQAAA
jgi:predicted dehydrogenase